MRRRRLGKFVVRRLALAEMRRQMTDEQRKAFAAREDLRELAEDAVDDWYDSLGDEPIDWATFFQELLAFIAGLMEILGPLLVTT